MNEDSTEMSPQGNTDQQKESVVSHKLTYALVFVALLIAAAVVFMFVSTSSSNSSSNTAGRANVSDLNQNNPERAMWGVDLSEIGFGQVDFGALWFAPAPPAFFGSYLDPATSRCQINHHPDFNPELPLSEQPGALSFGTTMIDLAQNLFKCASTDFTNARDWYEIADAWLLEYSERCGDLSFNRIGWPGDPETGPGIECVPHFEEFMK